MSDDRPTKALAQMAIADAVIYMCDNPKAMGIEALLPTAFDAPGGAGGEALRGVLNFDPTKSNEIHAQQLDQAAIEFESPILSTVAVVVRAGGIKQSARAHLVHLASLTADQAFEDLRVTG